MSKDGNTRRVRRVRFDRSTMTLTLISATGDQRYSCAGLSVLVRDYLTLLGLKAALFMNRNADVAYADLVAGIVPEQKPFAPPRKSKWREAIAYTLAATKVQMMAVKGTKKAVIDQMIAQELPAMTEHAFALPRIKVRQLGERPDVQEHYRRMFGAKTQDAQMSLLALAGVIEPMALPGGDYEHTEHAAAA